jgi:copper(I)-binding protein
MDGGTHRAVNWAAVGGVTLRYAPRLNLSARPKEIPMHNPRYLSRFAVVLAASLALPAAAQVAVTDAWVRGTVAGQKATGAFMHLTALSDMTLVAVASPMAKVVEIHEMKHEGGMMKMNAVDRVTLPAGKSVELKPGGYHVMLMDLAQPLKEGEAVPLTLTFEDKAGKKQTVEVKATVRALTAAAGK